MDAWQMFDDLARLETQVWNCLDALLLEQCGIGVGAYNALVVIDRTDKCRVNDLAAALAITVGGASQAVDRFEKQGLIARSPNPANRRSSLLDTTDRGRDALTTAKGIVDAELERRLVAPLGKAQAEQFAAHLSALRASWPESD